MKTPSKDLHELIHAMNKSEKRYFKLYSSLQQGSKEYMKLFDAINDQEEYDEVRLKTELKSESIASYIPKAKNKLYDMVLKSLNAYHANNSPELEVKEMLSSIEVLYKKGLAFQAIKLIQRAKEIAELYELYPLLLEALRWEFKTMVTTKSFSPDHVRKHFDTERGIHATRLDGSKYEEIALNSVSYALTEGQARSEQDKKKLQDKFNIQLKEAEKHARDFSLLSTIYRANVFYYYCLQEDSSFYDYCKKLVDIFDRNPHFILNDLNAYVHAYGNFLISQASMGKWKEFEETLTKIRQLPKKLTPSKMDEIDLSMFKLYYIELNMCALSGQFKRGTELVPEVEAGMKKYVKKLDKAYEFEYYANIAVCYFGIKNYTKALHWINAMLNHPDIEIWEHMHSHARIMNLLIHFELKNYELLDSLIKSTHRFLNKKQRLFKFESVIIEFVKKAQYVESESDRIKYYKKIKAECEEISKEDPSGSVLIQSFDLITWLTSKIEKKEFEQLVRNKTKVR